MGHGIAQIFCAAGHKVCIHDPADEVLQVAPGKVREIFELLGQDPSGVDNLSLHDSLDTVVAEVELVIEAAPENLELKQGIFEKLTETTGSGTILASNTSSIPISQIAARSSQPERIVGTHFWNPPHLVPLVEVIQGERTDTAIVEETIQLLTAVGKTAVHAKKDIPGFIGNRMQHALKREAIALVENGVCDAETVDLVVKEGFGMRFGVMGPLENSDLVGLNLTLAIHETLLTHLDISDGPQKLLQDKVSAGELGMSVGQGFRSWTPDEAEAQRNKMRDHLVQYARQRIKDRSEH